MRLLLDTHVFLWLADAPEKLTERALEACKNRRNPIYFSVVSAWEIQVKSQLGKLTLDDPSTAANTCSTWPSPERATAFLYSATWRSSIRQPLLPPEVLGLLEEQMEATSTKILDVWRGYSVE